MARKEKTFTINKTASRDNGKSFKITEMPAIKAEKWARNMLHVLSGANVDIPDDVASDGGMAGIAAYAIKSVVKGIGGEEAEPLLDEMMRCVEIIEPAITRPLTPDDIEEVETILILRSEVLELHTGFSIAGVISGILTRTPASTDSNNIETSPRQ